MARNIICRPWGGTKGPWLCLMGTLSLFGLLWPFSFVYAFFHVSDEACSWASIFPQTKGKLKMWGVGNCRGVLLRFTYLLLFGWVSFLQSVLWPPEGNRLSWGMPSALSLERETPCLRVRWLVCCPVSLESSVLLATAQRRAEWLKLVVWWLSVEG